MAAATPAATAATRCQPTRVGSAARAAAAGRWRPGTAAGPARCSAWPPAAASPSLPPRCAGQQARQLSARQTWLDACTKPALAGAKHPAAGLTRARCAHLPAAAAHCRRNRQRRAVLRARPPLPAGAVGGQRLADAGAGRRRRRARSTRQPLAAAGLISSLPVGAASRPAVGPPRCCLTPHTHRRRMFSAGVLRRVRAFARRFPLAAAPPGLAWIAVRGGLDDEEGAPPAGARPYEVRACARGLTDAGDCLPATSRRPSSSQPGVHAPPLRCCCCRAPPVRHPAVMAGARGGGAGGLGPGVPAGQARAYAGGGAAGARLACCCGGCLGPGLGGLVARCCW